MKRTIRVLASDGQTRIEVVAKVSTDGSLTANEVNCMAEDLADALMLLLEGVRYTGFRLSQMKVGA